MLHYPLLFHIFPSVISLYTNFSLLPRVWVIVLLQVTIAVYGSTQCTFQYGMHYIFSVCCDITSPVVMASNSRHSPFSQFLNCPRASAMANSYPQCHWRRAPLHNWTLSNNPLITSRHRLCTKYHSSFNLGCLQNLNSLNIWKQYIVKGVLWLEERHSVD
jgi:hypothetical protein